MKKRIILSFLGVFLFFSVAIGAAFYNLLFLSSNLRYQLKIHEVESLRQNLLIHFQNIQNNLYEFSFKEKRPNKISFDLEEIDGIILECKGCHHQPNTKRKIQHIEREFQNYKERINKIISHEEIKTEEIKEIISLGQDITKHVHNIIHKASIDLHKKTQTLISTIKKTIKDLSIILIISLISALLVAKYLTTSIISPVKDLLKSIESIEKEDYTPKDFPLYEDEFGQIFKAIDKMRSSLNERDVKIKTYLNRLYNLHKLTILIHSKLDKEYIIERCLEELKDLTETQLWGIAIKGSPYMLRLRSQEGREIKISIPPQTLEGAWSKGQGKPLVCQKDAATKWPLGSLPPDFELKNFLILWLMTKSRVLGALVFINHPQGFSEEEINLFGILASSISVALENIDLYTDLEDKIKELNATQRQLVEAEKLTAIGTLTSGIAHDFNNVLCAIMGHISILKESPHLDKGELRALETIERAAERGAELSRRLLSFARQRKWDFKPLDVNQSVKNVVDLLKHTIDRRIRIRLELEELPPIKGSSTQLEQMIMNLCLNACEAMPEGGILSLMTSLVYMDENNPVGVRPGRYVHLVVADTGQGMDEETLAHIFEPFFTTKEGRGTGLGLAMVANVIHEHGGHCQVVSRLGRGTAFHIYLPVDEGQKAESPSPKEVTLAKGARARGFILVVDDEEPIREMLKTILERAGHRVVTAANGQEALEVADEEGQNLDLVILDINMPLLSGREAFNRLRGKIPGVKVLIASGLDLDPRMDPLLREADGYLRKPFYLDELLAKVSEILASE
ncbi:ATP-binding protein [Thermosulfuriphilus ammonigenes]